MNCVMRVCPSVDASMCSSSDQFQEKREGKTEVLLRYSKWDAGASKREIHGMSGSAVESGKRERFETKEAGGWLALSKC